MTRKIVAAGAGVGVLLMAILLAVFALKTSGRFSKVEGDLAKKTDAAQVVAVVQQKLTDGTVEAKFKKVVTEEITADTAVIKGIITLGKISTGSGDPFKPEPINKDELAGALAKVVATEGKNLEDKLKADFEAKLKAAEKAAAIKAKAAEEAAAKAKAAAEAKAKEAELAKKPGIKELFEAGAKEIADRAKGIKDEIKGLKEAGAAARKFSDSIEEALKSLAPPVPKPKKAPKMPVADEEAKAPGMIGPRLTTDEVGVRFVLHVLEPPGEAVKVLAHRLERTRSDQEFLRAQIRPLYKPKYWWLETWYLEQQKLRWWVDYRLKRQVEDLSSLLAVAKNELGRSPASRIPIRIPWCWTTERPPRRFWPTEPPEQVGAAVLYRHGYNRYPVA